MMMRPLVFWQDSLAPNCANKAADATDNADGVSSIRAIPRGFCSRSSRLIFLAFDTGGLLEVGESGWPLLQGV
jgi:hypothetical protein